MKTACFIVLIAFCWGCNSDEKEVEYPKGTLTITCAKYYGTAQMHPYVGARVYFFDFNQFREKDRMTASPSGFDIESSRLDLVGGRHLDYTQKGIADKDGKVIMQNVAYGWHWLICTYLDEEDPEKEVGFMMKQVFMDSPDDEAFFSWL